MFAFKGPRDSVSYLSGGVMTNIIVSKSSNNRRWNNFFILTLMSTSLQRRNVFMVRIVNVKSSRQNYLVLRNRLKLSILFLHFYYSRSRWCIYYGTFLEWFDVHSLLGKWSGIVKSLHINLYFLFLHFHLWLCFHSLSLLFNLFAIFDRFRNFVGKVLIHGRWRVLGVWTCADTLHRWEVLGIGYNVFNVNRHFLSSYNINLLKIK